MNMDDFNGLVAVLNQILQNDNVQRKVAEE